MGRRLHEPVRHPLRGLRDAEAHAEAERRLLPRRDRPEPRRVAAGSLTPDPASRIPRPGSRVPDPASRIPRPGSRVPDPASRIPRPGSRVPDPGSRIPDPGSRIPDLIHHYWMRTSRLPTALLLVSMLATGACRSASTPPPSAPIVQPGAPGEPSRVVQAPAATRGPSFTDADVNFMQGMIHHHAQAIDMVELLKTHTTSDDMKKLGQRIELSQADEIT